MKTKFASTITTAASKHSNTPSQQRIQIRANQGCPKSSSSPTGFGWVVRNEAARSLVLKDRLWLAKLIATSSKPVVITHRHTTGSKYQQQQQQQQQQQRNTKRLDTNNITTTTNLKFGRRTCAASLPKSSESQSSPVLSRSSTRKPTNTMMMGPSSKLRRCFSKHNMPTRSRHDTVFANKRFCDFVGLSMDDIVGKDCWFLQGKPKSCDSDSPRVNRVRAVLALESRDSITVQMIVVKASGESVVCDVELRALFGSTTKSAVMYVGVIKGCKPLTTLSDTHPEPQLQQQQQQVCQQRVQVVQSLPQSRRSSVGSLAHIEVSDSDSDSDSTVIDTDSVARTVVVLAAMSAVIKTCPIAAPCC